jgi:phytanoyl-CoA hydroxylase
MRHWRCDDAAGAAVFFHDAMSANMSLTHEQQEFYSANGYIHIKSVFTVEECSLFRDEMHALAERLGNPDATWASVRHADTKITHCHDVQFESGAITRLLTDSRFTGVAQAIIGPNVQLHHTKMFIKPPENGSPFPMHQDYYYFPHAGNSMTAAIMHFDDTPVEKGCLRVVPGSHKLGPLDPVGEDRHLPGYAIEDATAIPAKAGDVIFFNYLLIHGSGLNLSDEARTTLLVQMRDPEDRPTVERHLSKGQGMMLAGVNPMQ